MYIRISSWGLYPFTLVGWYMTRIIGKEGCSVDVQIWIYFRCIKLCFVADKFEKLIKVEQHWTWKMFVDLQMSFSYQKILESKKAWMGSQSKRDMMPNIDAKFIDTSKTKKIIYYSAVYQNSTNMMKNRSRLHWN